jgi:hypothetical protein
MRLVYTQPHALVVNAAPSPLVELTAGDAAAGDERNISIVSTPDHRLYVRADGGRFEKRLARDVAALRGDVHFLTAAANGVDVSTCGGDMAPHCDAAAELPLAPRGVATSTATKKRRRAPNVPPCAPAAPVAVDASLRAALESMSLTDAHASSFLELYGFWLGAGGVACGSAASLVFAAGRRGGVCRRAHGARRRGV